MHCIIIHVISDIQLKKLASVIGLDDQKLNDWKNPVDPNYVLTFDNLIKILAIILRFRYHHFEIHVCLPLILLCVCCRSRIPVIIMGETGCGKTRLLRFVCNLLSHPMKSDNFLPVKVL